jgi:type IV secretion system protein VirB10
MLPTLLVVLLLQAPAPVPTSVTAPDPQASTVVPAGTTIPVALINTLSTKNAHEGDGVYVRTTFPITVNNEIVIPVGSHIRGKVTQVQRPGRVKGKGEMTLSFQEIIMPSGTTIPLYGTLGTVGNAAKREGETGVEGDSSKGHDVGTVTKTGVEGAAIGAIAAHSVKGAGVGGAVGGLAGLGAVLFTRGKDIVLQPGTTMEIVLDRPLSPSK